MDRRKFIISSSLASVAVTSLSFAGCRSAEAEKDNSSHQEPIAAFELDEITIETLQAAMNSGEYTSEKIVKLYLDRINSIDKSGPALNSVIELNPDAIYIAQGLDKERKAGKIRGPLHGIPVLLKDNIDTGDKMMTTAGSLAMVGNHPEKDAFVVEQLRKAGAVILGKTNLSEWANFRSSKSTSGWSSRGGLTKNPYALDRNACGSSSGSGVAVSANLCTVAVGTETDGSVVCPASFNGIVGMKPTIGLVSRAGIIPISHTQDTAGPMARTVRDLAILLSCMAGVDQADPVTQNSVTKPKADYLKATENATLKGKRIGIDKAFLQGEDLGCDLFRKVVDQIKAKGGECIEVDILSKMNELYTREFELMKFEFKADLNAYLAKSTAKVKSMQDVIDFNKANADKVMPFFKQDILEASQKKADLNSTEYLELLRKNNEESRVLIDRTLSENRLDAISGVTIGPAGTTDLILGDHYLGDASTAPAAIAGYPHISVPMGEVYGLPVGISFYSSAFEEARLINLAAAFEKEIFQRHKPKFKSTLF
ncbi:MAG: amidase [Bacteroidetes bacterium]|nr:amidase [Bacteroidota bacterium]